MTARCTGLKLIINVLTSFACSSMMTFPAGGCCPSIGGYCPRGDSYQFRGAAISEHHCSSPCSGKYKTAATCTAGFEMAYHCTNFVLLSPIRRHHRRLQSLLLSTPRRRLQLPRPRPRTLQRTSPRRRLLLPSTQAHPRPRRRLLLPSTKGLQLLSNKATIPIVILANMTTRRRMPGRKTRRTLRRVTLKKHRNGLLPVPRRPAKRPLV